METEVWKSRKYKTWDEAFRGLMPVVRQQSVRVAEYTRVLFAKACEMPYYTKGSNRAAYLREEFTEVAYKCGLYHQIGKATLPPEYQIWREDLAEEEKELYLRYPVQGSQLVTRLQGKESDADKVSLSCLMIREACEQHMERWNGSGYPHGKKKEDISLIAQMVGLAKELDTLASGIHSENPFEEAIGTLMYRKGTWFSDNLIETMKNCRNELKDVYRKYIQYTRTVPQTIPLVEKRSERPFGLRYRLVMQNSQGLELYEAVPWFCGVADEEEQLVSWEQIEGALKRTGLLKDVELYLLYESADTLIRLKNWGYRVEGILFPICPEFFQEDGAEEDLRQFFIDQPVEKNLIKFMIPASRLEEVKPYMEQGMEFVATDYRSELAPPPKLQEMGITYVRFPEKTEDDECRKELTDELHQFGITVAESHAALTLFSEEDLIRQIESREEE